MITIENTQKRLEELDAIKAKKARQKDIMRQAIFHYGKEAQVKKCIEEMSELTVALLHKADKKCDYKDVVTEIADVIIMARQMQLIFGENEVNAEIEAKLTRLQNRLK